MTDEFKADKTNKNPLIENREVNQTGEFVKEKINMKRYQDEYLFLLSGSYSIRAIH